jgi:hypothetical protein
MQSRIARVAVACAALLLAVPAGASAEPKCHRQIKATTYDVTLRGSHGYEVEIESSPSGKVTLSANKTTGFGGFLVEYTVKGRSDERGLEADFGPLGRIAVHFHRQRPVLFGAETVRLEGRIEFHGEQGFTSISRRRARGAVFRKFKRACSAPSSGERARASHAGIPNHGDSRVTTLVAAERTPNRAVLLRLQSSQPPRLEEDGGDDFLVAGLEERRQQMSIRRGLLFEDPVATVTPSPLGTEPASGSVMAPGPFFGTATYSRTLGSPTSLSGDLTVSLPGATNVPLTGPGFSAVVCGGKAEPNRLEKNRLERCQEESEELVEASLLLPLPF